jgi:hypothetical protein
LGAITIFICLFWLLFFYSIVIIAKYIDNNSNSFVNIDDFNLDNNGANIEEPNNYNKDPTILLSNIGGTPLNIINEEDKGPIFSLILKKTRRGIKILLIK